MNTSIGMACNFYCEPYALHGLLENASHYFHDLLFISTPPIGVDHDEESIEIIKKWGATLKFSSIEEGYGVIRTMCIHESSTEWVMIMDADERFYPINYKLTCEGEEKYPEVQRPNLTIKKNEEIINFGNHLKNIISDPKIDCVRSLRRHWFDFSFKNPCENWQIRKDWQCRILRNKENIGFDPKIKMHERVLDTHTQLEPYMWRSEDTEQTVFYDHFHCFFKPMEKENNKEDSETYERLSKGCVKDMWLNNIIK